MFRKSRYHSGHEIARRAHFQRYALCAKFLYECRIFFCTNTMADALCMQHMNSSPHGRRPRRFTCVDGAVKTPPFRLAENNLILFCGIAFFVAAKTNSDDALILIRTDFVDSFHAGSGPAFAIDVGDKAALNAAGDLRSTTAAQCCLRNFLHANSIFPEIPWRKKGLKIHNMFVVKTKERIIRGLLKILNLAEEIVLPFPRRNESRKIPILKMTFHIFNAANSRCSTVLLNKSEERIWQKSTFEVKMKFNLWHVPDKFCQFLFFIVHSGLRDCIHVVDFFRVSAASIVRTDSRT